MSIDLKLDNQQNLVLENGDLTLVQDGDEVIQSFRIHMLTILGEWVFDYTIGVDWFDSLFNSSTTDLEKEMLIRGVLLGVEHVRRILQLEFFKDNTERSARIEFSVDTDYGPISAELTI